MKADSILKKFVCAVMLLVFVITGSLPASASTKNDITGLEWLQLSISKRMEYIAYAMYVLTENGVELEGTPNDYYNVVDHRLKMRPSLYSSKIINLVASVVYEDEPQTREALDQYADQTA